MAPQAQRQSFNHIFNGLCRTPFTPASPIDGPPGPPGPPGHTRPRLRPRAEILGQFQRAHTAAGGPPVQIFTKYVPNIFQQRPTPAIVEAAVRRAITKLQVCGRGGEGRGGTEHWTLGVMY
jgi:hypothetical protein